MNKQISAIILDWAGTAVDFGSMAPVAAFRKAFGHEELFPGDELIRRFMGLSKKDHVRNMLHDGELKKAFEVNHGIAPGEADVERI